MTKSSFRLTLFFLVCFSIPLTVTAQTVDIPDPNLRAAIATQLSKPSGATITTADMANLTELTARNASIRDLTGLEAATNLTWLNLSFNSISDISPIAQLTNLTILYLSSNFISDILPVARLTNLEYLSLSFNSISDISPVARLTNLTGLWLDRNSISDISPIARLTNLISLHLSGNSISDISPVARLTNLTGLSLEFNSISNISPIARLTNLTGLRLGDNSISDISTVTGLTNLEHLSLGNNPISDISPVARLTNLTALSLGGNSISDISTVIGLTNLEYLSLESNSISDISPLARLTNLTDLYLTFNSISDISPLARLTNLISLHLTFNSISDISAITGLTYLRELYLEDNSISDISPLVTNTGLGQGDTVDVKGNPLSEVSINTHIRTLQNRGVTVEFDNLTPVDIPDPNLRAAIEGALGKAPGDTITADDMANLTRLSALPATISDLTGLETATNLTWLYLSNNFISDISPVTGLTNLTTLWLGDNSISDISPVARLTNLTVLHLTRNSISDISAVAQLTNLTDLYLGGNSISDISPVTGLTNLTDLYLGGNSISDISPVTGLTNLTDLYLTRNSISDISAVAQLTNLTDLYLTRNSISDISPVARLTNLTVLHLDRNSISDISSVTGLTNLTVLWFGFNSISDISPVARLTNLTDLYLGFNSISDISPVTGLTNLTWLHLSDNSISDISPIAQLTNLTTLSLGKNSISDISPLVANTGLGQEDTVSVPGNPLSDASINTYIPALQSRGVEVYFDALEPATPEYLLSIPAGISLIHVPLKVTEVDGAAQTIESIADLYDALGGGSKVTFLITYDSQAQEWRSYFGTSDKGTPADRTLTDDMGIIAGMIRRVDIRLGGDALGTNGSGTITINPGLNLVGLPLRDSRITRVNDLFALDGIGGNVPVIILTDNGEFKAVGRADDPGDIPIVGGQAFILTAQRAATVTISGDGWTNTSGTAAAPSMALTGIEVGDTTPVLGLRGAIVDEKAGLKVDGFRVTVKNLSTDRAVAAVTAPDEAGYRLTIVDIETGRAATIGDTLEISAQSPNPFIGVKPLRYTITAEDVKRSRIQLPELVAYEIPAETQLLPNYPNPFNPETWIPYRLAEDAFVTLTIYDLNGRVVRTIDVGLQTAAFYESRAQAIYWDGRNEVGETVASGVYFYNLSAGNYSATRKMLILK